MGQMLSARKARRELEVLIDMGDGTEVRARKEDMTLLVFEGRVPMPLLAAVQRMIDMPNVSDVERVAALGQSNSRDLVRILREHVAAVLLDPKCSVEMTDDPDVLPVTYFSVPQLMAIWTATAVVPRFTTPEAQRFRERPVGDDALVAPTSEDVPPAPEPVGVTEYDIVTG